MLANLWQHVRVTITGLEGEVVDLEAQVVRRSASRSASADVASTVSRPDTTESVLQRRQALESSMDDLAAGQVPEAVVAAIKDLPPAWVEGKLQGYRSRTREDASDTRFGPQGLGCWFPSQESGHPRGYTRVNWRNSVAPNGARIGVNPYLHQLAAVARGLGSRLLLAQQHGTHHVSHLCHNTACMNPGHVTVESSQKNQSRKPCNGAVKLRFPDGSLVNPCKCGSDGSPDCVLPVWAKPPERGYWVFTESGPARRA